MSEIQPFTFPESGQRIRAVLIDEEPWFVLGDAAQILRYRDAFNAGRLLDEDEKGTHLVSTPGGDQRVSIISESGLYLLIMRSNMAKAKEFRRWVTGEVLPTIRKTGKFEAAPSFQLPQTYAAALRELAATVERAEQAEQQLAVAAPAADAWHVLASAHGDYSVREAAFMLNRDPSISTGQQRLFKTLREFGLIDRRNIPYATHEAHVRLRAGSWTHPHTGEERPTTQVRVTFEGLRYLHKRLGGSGPFDAIVQAA